MLEVRNLGVSVGGRLVVREASMKIEGGKISILMGPNGSGKTSLLRAIAGIPGYEIVSGRILLDGEDITDLEPWERARRGIAIMHQNPPRLSIKFSDFLDELAKKFGGGDVRERCSALMISHLLRRNLFEGFSGGEAKRAELAVVRAMSPRYALLDEPDSGVDLESIKLLSACINDLASEGVGVLVITHQGYILNFLENLWRGYVLVDGKMVDFGSAREAYKMVLRKGFRGMGK